jgi:2'-5' RNA ligase
VAGGRNDVRLFTAIELDDRVKDLLARARESLRRHDRVVRWVTRDQMHLTLVFLGEVPEARVDEVCQAVQRAAKRVAPFEIVVAGNGCFPPRGHVRVIWVGTEDQGGQLKRCQAVCADELEAIGFPRESRPFSAHLTLGRVREDTTNGALRNDVERLKVPSITQYAGSIHVIQSELTPHGARYVTVASCGLEG